MTVSVSGNVPDTPYEILVSTGAVPGIDVDGSGTDMITLTNAGGARSTDFKDALAIWLMRFAVLHSVASGSFSSRCWLVILPTVSLPIVRRQTSHDIEHGPSQHL